MKLSKQEMEAKERGVLAQDFLKGDLYQKYLKSRLNQMLDNLYPDPTKRGWEKKYIFAKASEKVIENLISTLASWQSEAKMLSDKEKDEEKSIEEA